MKTPANPFTIHVMEANYVVKDLAAPRPSIWVRARPSMAQGLTRAGRGLVQSGRLAIFLVTTLSHMIALVGIGVVEGIRLINYVSLRLLELVFITIPMFVIGLCFVLATIACAWGLVEAMYRGLYQLPRP